MRGALLTVLFSLFWIGSPHAWETTRNGPIVVGLSAPLEAAQLAANGTVPRLISQKTLEYPYQSGARLGDAWNFVTDERMYSQCIDFGEAADTYQQANLNFSRVVDEETLSVALNITTSAHASGGFAGISANAAGSLGIDAAHKFTSKDDLIVAHASVVNGATYVAAQNGHSVSGNAIGSPGSTTSANIFYIIFPIWTPVTG